MLLSKKQFKYGYFEIRFKLPGAAPAGKHWNGSPNFWLYQGNDTNGTPYCEIDIYEINGYNNTYTSNIHYRRSNWTTDSSQFHSPGTISGNTWHTAGLLWTSDAVKYYLDGVNVYDMTKKEVRTDSLMPMQIVIDVSAPANNFCTYFDANTAFDYTYEVDYVKVWQLNYGCSQNDKTFCSNFDPANYGRIYKSVVLDGSSCVDAITNKNYTDALGTKYVTLDAGFSIDNNSTVIINSQGCSSDTIPFSLAPGPPQQGYISHTQHNSEQ
jgi:beta-glucanase (GH16 family)